MIGLLPTSARSKIEAQVRASMSFNDKIGKSWTCKGTQAERNKLGRGEFLMRNVFERHRKHIDFTRNSTLVYRRIFVYTFCLINICLSLSDDANKIKTLNIERA